MSSKEHPLDIIEFKSWLDGVEAMQPADWVPNEAQWKIIREKIGKFCKDLENASQTKSTPTHFAAHRDAIPSTTSTSFPEVPSPRVSEIQSRVAQTSTLTPPPMMPHSSIINDSVESTIKTPSIDTSNGVYNSPFSK